MSKTVEERLAYLESLVDQLVNNNNKTVLFIVDNYKHGQYVSASLYNEIDYIEKEEDDDSD